VIGFIEQIDLDTIFLYRELLITIKRVVKKTVKEVIKTMSKTMSKGIKYVVKAGVFFPFFPFFPYKKI
jgi:hypothetical protein